MTTDGQPPSCDPDIFKNGTTVCILAGDSWKIENWVQKLARRSGAKVDWHFAGGRANVLHLGDKASYWRVLSNIQPIMDEFDGQFLHYESELL